MSTLSPGPTSSRPHSRSPSSSPAWRANVSLVLDTLKDVLEATDSLPIVTYVASVAVKILEVVEVCVCNSRHGGTPDDSTGDAGSQDEQGRTTTIGAACTGDRNHDRESMCAQWSWG